LVRPEGLETGLSTEISDFERAWREAIASTVAE
jgi:hypothetical protein